MTVTIRPHVTLRYGMAVKGFSAPILKLDASNTASYLGTGTHWLNTAGTDGATYGFGSAEFGSYGSIKWGGDSTSSWLANLGSPILNTVLLGDVVVIDGTTMATVVGSGALPGTATGYYSGQTGFQLDITRDGVADWTDFNIGSIRIVHKNAVLRGDVTYSAGPSALNFTSTGGAEEGYVQVTPGVYFNHSYTTEGWVYVNSWANWSRLFDFGNSGTDEVLLAVSEGIQGYPVFSCGGVNIVSPYTIPLEEWVHLTATYNYKLKNATLYMNGAQVVTQNEMPPTTQNAIRNQCYIGRSNYRSYSDQDLEGAVGEFAIYPFAMSGTEVLAQYNTRKTHYGL